MNKQLLDQIQQALASQQDTIERQEQMLNEKDEDISILRASLTKLAQTQSEELKRLPSLFKDLKNSIEGHTSTWSEWNNHRKQYSETMRELANESNQLCKNQIQLVELMKEYQSTLVPVDKLTSDTERLEKKLEVLMGSQREIDSSQKKISEIQQVISTELNKLNRLSKS